jgi:hypothetical protein
MSKRLLLEKYIKVAVKKALKEAEEQQRQANKALYLIYRFPHLKELMEDLMSPAFGRYIKHIEIVSPKPTTFRVDLINGQEFNITYVGKKHFTTKIAGKKYNPANLGELERASDSITELLQLNYAVEEGKEQTPSSGAATPDAGLAADVAAAAAPPPTPTGGETPPAETPPAETPPTEETPPAA